MSIIVISHSHFMRRLKSKCWSARSLTYASSTAMPSGCFSKDAPIIANGFSRRYQARQDGGWDSIHIAVLLRDALASN
ncbi:hypothetical protein [Methylocella tundrae]|uniref:hypothetical protein n=1 Tax=Methylocella tundrae TaxID=227605 RepID=UPI00157A72F9|nr:hypothetical protein [Methylocella tundrae]